VSGVLTGVSGDPAAEIDLRDGRVEEPAAEALTRDARGVRGDFEGAILERGE
jgi:hypothetical protein